MRQPQIFQVSDGVDDDLPALDRFFGTFGAATRV